MADRHLPEGFDRKKITHRMGKNVDLMNSRVANEHYEQLLERVTRQVRAFPVVAIGEDAGARRPGEQDRSHFGVQVVDDLREPEDGVAEAIVVTVDEDQHPMLVPSRAMRVEPRLGRLRVEAIGLRGHEVGAGIARRPPWQLDLAGPPRAIRRDRHDDVGEAERSALA